MDRYPSIEGAYLPIPGTGAVCLPVDRLPGYTAARVDVIRLVRLVTYGSYGSYLGNS